MPDSAPPPYARLLGICAGMLALLNVLVSASSAAFNHSAAIRVQRSFIDDALGGGAIVTPPLVALAPVWVVTYLSMFLVFFIALGFAAYAGYIAASADGTERRGAAAGRVVLFLATLIWSVALLFASVALQLDGTFSWLVALLAGLAVKTPSRTQLFTQHPTLVYIVVQVVMMLVHILFFGILGAWLGGAAGHAGARRAMRDHFTRANPSGHATQLSPQ